jgi:hypothetical protein
MTSPLASRSPTPEILGGVPINPASGHTPRSRLSPWSWLSFGAIIQHCMGLCRPAFGTQIARDKSATFSSRQAVADRGRSR